mgnify:FL=1
MIGNFKDTLPQKSHKSKQNETTCITWTSIFVLFLTQSAGIYAGHLVTREFIVIRK